MDEDFNTYDYTPNHHLPYPNNNQENIDLIENITKLAEAVEDSLDDVDDGLEDKQDTADKTTTIGADSTDTQYPSAKAVYNLFKENKKVYNCGVRIYRGQSSSALTRLGDAVGKTAAATLDGSYVANDFDNIPPFSLIREEKRHKTTHKILSIKGDSDYSSVDGEVMIHFPDTYWKFEEAADKSYYDMWVSNVLQAGYFKVDEFCVGKYPLVDDNNNVLCTKSGYQAKGWTSLTSFRSAVAAAYGANACLMDWRYDVICSLYLIEFADFNSQTKLGQRQSTFRYNFANDKALIAENNTNRIIINTTGGNAFIVGQQIGLGTSDGGTQIAKCRTITSKANYSEGGVTGVAITFDGDPVNITTSVAIMTYAQFTGTTDNVLASSGSTSNNGKVAACYRGFETNSIFDWIDGMAEVNGVYKVCYDPSRYSSTDLSGYEDVDIDFPAVTSGYIKDLGFDINNPFCRRPSELGGGSSTYVTDYCWNNPSGAFGCRVGGNPTNGAPDGLFCFHETGGFGATPWSCGARVLLYNL